MMDIAKEIFDQDVMPADIFCLNKFFICQASLAINSEITLLNKGDYFQIKKDQIQIKERIFFDGQGFLVGYIVSDNGVLHKESSFQQIMYDFRKRIIFCWIKLLRVFVDEVWNHLKVRGSSIKKLGDNPAIQILIGDVLIHLQAAEQFVYQTSHDQFQFEQNCAMQECKSASELLAKLYGGRAFLLGSVVELMAFFAYFKKIYFCNDFVLKKGDY